MCLLIVVLSHPNILTHDLIIATIFFIANILLISHLIQKMDPNLEVFFLFVQYFFLFKP